MKHAHYSPKDFFNSMPKWKRRKDPFFTKIFFRPLSFVLSSFLANLGISANAVSIFSIFVSIAAAVLFCIPNIICTYVAGGIVCFWLILDCIDGNLARTVKKQLFGDFLDALACYILIGLCFTGMGISVYNFGGLLFKQGSIYPILFGAFASIADLIARVAYQKYKNSEYDHVKEGKMTEQYDAHKDKAKTGSLRSRIENELFVGGIVPLLILFCSIFSVLDIALIYLAAYCGLEAIVTVCLLLFKVHKNNKNNSINE